MWLLNSGNNNRGGAEIAPFLTLNCNVMAAMKLTYYCIAFRLWGSAICGVFDTLESFTKEIGNLYRAFEAPSQMDTCSVRAYSRDKAYTEAVEYFNENGWNIRG